MGILITKIEKGEIQLSDQVTKNSLNLRNEYGVSFVVTQMALIQHLYLWYRTL